MAFDLKKLITICIKCIELTHFLSFIIHIDDIDIDIYVFHLSFQFNLDILT